MKKVSIVLGCLLLLGFSTNALAAKSSVAHCGCNDDGTDLVWTYLEVSSKSKGHMQHNMSDLEECYIDVWDEGAQEWVEVYVDTYERTADDCTFNGTTLSGLLACDPVPLEGESCAAGEEPL